MRVIFRVLSPKENPRASAGKKTSRCGQAGPDPDPIQPGFTGLSWVSRRSFSLRRSETMVEAWQDVTKKDVAPAPLPRHSVSPRRQNRVGLTKGIIMYRRPIFHPSGVSGIGQYSPSVPPLQELLGRDAERLPDFTIEKCVPFFHSENVDTRNLVGGSAVRLILGAALAHGHGMTPYDAPSTVQGRSTVSTLEHPGATLRLVHNQTTGWGIVPVGGALLAAPVGRRPTPGPRNHGVALRATGAASSAPPPPPDARCSMPQEVF